MQIVINGKTYFCNKKIFPIHRTIHMSRIILNNYGTSIELNMLLHKNEKGIYESAELLPNLQLRKKRKSKEINVHRKPPNLFNQANITLIPKPKSHKKKITCHYSL